MSHNMFVLCKESEGGNEVVFDLKDKKYFICTGAPL